MAILITRKSHKASRDRLLQVWAILLAFTLQGTTGFRNPLTSPVAVNLDAEFAAGPWFEFPNLQSSSATTLEYQVKAVFLFNFTQFVEWPTYVFPEAQTPLIIGVLGEDPFGPYLDQTLRGEASKTHPLIAQRYRSIEEIQTCHILFISRSQRYRLQQVLASLKDKSILTVSDVPGFARQGGIIQFITQENKIRLRINVEAAKASGLRISSKMLRLAEIVGEGKN